jgi:protease IV
MGNDTDTPAAAPGTAPQPMPVGNPVLGLLFLVLLVASIGFGGILLVKGVPVPRKASADAEGTPSLLTKSDDGVAVVKVYGPIQLKDEKMSFGKSGGGDSVVTQLKKYRKSKNVKAVVLRVNSPGGTIAASQEIHNQVKELAKKVPVVVSMGDVCASGGYYISAPATFIYVNPGTITGSIGVITQTMIYEKVIEKIGVTFPTFKSGEFKDIGAGHRPMRPEEEKIFQGIVDGAYQQFLQACWDGRQLNAESEKKKPTGRKPVLTSIDQLRKLADGRVFLGRDAVANGLADAEGDLEDAISKAGKLAGLGENPTVIKGDGGLDDIMEMFSSESVGSQLASALARPASPVMYLWQPGL